jgi:hypothetical protein
LGLNRTLLVAGLVVPVLVVAVYPRLASIDRLAGARAEALAPRTRVLESLQIFAAAPPSVLERLASAAKDSTVEAGDVIITEALRPTRCMYSRTVRSRFGRRVKATPSLDTFGS